MRENKKELVNWYKLSVIRRISFEDLMHKMVTIIGNTVSYN